MSLLCFFNLVSSSFSQELEMIADTDASSRSFGKISLRMYGAGTFNNAGLDSLSYDQWASFFSITVDGADRPVLGSYKREKELLVFRPRFLPDPNISYEVTFSSKELTSFVPDFSPTKESTWRVKFVQDLVDKAVVETIFPQGEDLPSNILRFYIQFSAAMGLENPYDFIHIEDSNGNRLDGPFVEFENGLWSGDRTRLTLLLHPGRIKRGVGPNLTQGEIFKIGKSYQLIISGEWQSGNGQKLQSTFQKEFSIVDAIRTTIEIEKWVPNSPLSKSTQLLIIQTDREIDYALSQRLVTVFDSSKNRIAGKTWFDSRETNCTSNHRIIGRKAHTLLK